MKVFLSWAGEDSRRLAEVLREWLPLVIQSLSPWMSSADIEKGARWSVELGRELDATGYGIISVTPTSQTSPWLLFETGALSKRFESNRVTPFLLGLRAPDLVGPLAQFQATHPTQDDVWSLVRGLNTACADKAISETLLQRTFQREWPDLEAHLATLAGQVADLTPTKPRRTQIDMLEEVLTRVRGIERQLVRPVVRPEVAPASERDVRAISQDDVYRLISETM